jgi:hypothetical protein
VPTAGNGRCPTDARESIYKPGAEKFCEIRVQSKLKQEESNHMKDLGLNAAPTQRKDARALNLRRDFFVQ